MKLPVWLRLPFPARTLGLAVTGVAVVMVMVDFHRQLSAGQRIIEDRNVLRTQVAQLEREQEALTTQIAYATTDAAVVAWAHSQGKLVKPGEVIVVPVAPANVTPTSAAATHEFAAAIPNWQLWAGLFFDFPESAPVNP